MVSNAVIQTFTGEMFDIFDPVGAKIHVKDISHALSMLCRYGGHSREFYSVAEHSVLMAQYFVDRKQQDLAKAALFHDATEAYMGDLVRPIKLQMPMYRDVEEKLRLVIFRGAGLPEEMPEEIKHADLRICNDEREMLMLARTWSIDDLEPLGVEVQCWTHVQAEQAWLDTYWRLFQ